jgi:NADH-quinone oxidoreductase subunit L
MFDTLAWIVPIAPLIGCLLCTLLAFRGDRDWAQWPAVLSLAISAGAAWMLLWSFQAEEGLAVVAGYRWLDIGGLRMDVSLRLDSLCLTLLSVVTTVSCLVAIYSRDYMRGDPGFARFYAVFTGFVFSMTMLVMANNLLLLYFFWEGVGTCSYLLIGYYYRKPSAAQAAIKAFLVNRVADCAFLLGILVLAYAVGQTAAGQASGVIGRLDFATIHQAADELARSEAYPSLIGWLALLFVIGAIGKSAQFPLHVWLPDAMEGPTPVSALIHAATMVTAGVYLMARMSPFMVHAPDVLVTLGWLGGITALAAAVMALYQDDLKRVLAYSTASQLGYLFMALSCGAVHDLMTVAVMAAMFHLVTHAFFKALLFLSAGNVMHAMGDVIDMRKFGGLKKYLPQTHVLFAIGAAALAGLPPLAAFFSKDTILSLLNDSRTHGLYDTHFACFLGIGFLTAFLTAIYTSKAYFKTFWGVAKLPPEAGHHPHEASRLMLAPMIVLAVGAVFAGGLLGPTGWILKYLSKTPWLPALHGEHHEPWWVLAASTVVAVVGILIGRQLANRPSISTSEVSLASGLADFGRQRLYIDALYQALIVTPMLGLGRFAGWFDRVVVGGVVRAVAGSPAGLGWLLRSLQAGLVSSYAYLTAIGVALVAAWVMWR